MKELWVVENPRIIYFMLFNLRVRDLFCILIITSWRYQWGNDLDFALKALNKSSNRGKKLVLLLNLRPKSLQNQTKLLEWGLLDRENG